MMEGLSRVDCAMSRRLQINEVLLNDLKNRALGLERSDRTQDAYLASYKFCPTRHGCSGATNCDYEYGAPVGR